jgi:hypothetical protein
MGRILYDSKRIIPAPTASISKQYQKTGGGRILSPIYTITLQGTIVAYKGSPASDGTFWTLGGYPADENISLDARLKAILMKQDAIRELFSVEGLQLEIQSDDGSAPTKCNPRVISIDFPEGLWYQTCPYTITLEADRLYPQDEDTDSLGTDFFISDASETWSLETDESSAESYESPRSYRLTHSISAQGKRSYNSIGGLDNSPSDNAKAYVLGKLGLNNSYITSSGVLNLASYYGGYNFARSENTDVEGGSHSVTESWVISSGLAFESFEVSTTYGIGDGLRRVSINGSIAGLEQRDSNLNLVTPKYVNAQAKFSGVSPNIFSRAQLYSGYSLNIVPTTETIGRNPIGGTISYAYEYDNRPSQAITNSLAESITVTDNGTSEEFAAIPVLGRSQGPVLQPLGTSQARTRTLSISANFGPQTIDTTDRNTLQASLLENPRTWPATATSINNIIDAVNPYNNSAYITFRGQPQESWDARNGTYNYSVTWVWEQ